MQRRWVLSGGLASGKSAARRMFADAGLTTIDADSVGHQMIQPDGPAFDEVARRWPQVVREGEINRRSLAEIVFNDPAELEALEAITHPHIFDTIRSRVEDEDTAVVLEIPLLEHGLGPGWSRIVIDSHDEVRLTRALQRGMDEGDARARIESQPPRARWLGAADLVIPNHGTMEDLEETVGAVTRAL